MNTQEEKNVQQPNDEQAKPVNRVLPRRTSAACPASRSRPAKVWVWCL